MSGTQNMDDEELTLARLLLKRNSPLALMAFFPSGWARC